MSRVDGVLNACYDEAQAELGDRTVAVGDDLGEVVTGVDVHDRERHLRGPERLVRQVKHDDRVLAATEQQDRPLELPGHLAEDVDRLGLESVKLAEDDRAAHSRRRLGRNWCRRNWCRRNWCRRNWCRRHRCNPHSVLSLPAQRPALGSSPGATARVQGAQPMEVKPSWRKGLSTTPYSST